MNARTLLAAADRCVKCGLCLPHCPTYELSKNEAESPRGRISLIQALLEGRLEDTPDLRAHLTHCLLCRNCERSCPSLVEYGALMDGARTYLARDRRPDWLLGTLTNPLKLRSLAGVSSLLQPLGINRLLPERQALMAGWLESRRTTRPATKRPTRPPSGQRVALFTGCVTRVTDAAVIDAAQRLLERLGWTVEIPRDQGCCGAMHMHQGFAAEAEDFMRRNREVFAGQDITAVLTVASGCGAQLVEHGGLEVPVVDVSAFLAGLEWPAELRSAIPARTVALHQPCSLRNVMRQDTAVLALLQHFEALQVVALDAGGCCGGAGLHLVEQPETALALATPFIEQLRDSGAEALLTSSTGCALSLATAADLIGAPVTVRHPVEFIAEQLGI